MKINKETIKELAHLSRLTFDKEQEDAIEKDLSNILSWIEKLNELDTSNIEPLVHITENVNIMRNDEIGEHLDHKIALKNAPKSDSDYIRVPKVIE